MKKFRNTTYAKNPTIWSSIFSESAVSFDTKSLKKRYAESYDKTDSIFAE